jgi:hypothetical protein
MGSARYEGGTVHLRFDKLPLEKGAKLHKYNVINETFGYVIGIIHWRGGWRQYVFQALLKIDMSRSCHKVIDDYIDKLMQEWKEKRIDGKC